MGTSPTQTILQGASASDYAVKFTSYIGAGVTPNGATLTNVQVSNSRGGVLVWDYTGGSRLNGITIRDVNVSTQSSGDQNGLLLLHDDKINVINTTVTSGQTAITLIDTTQSLIANSSVTSTTANFANALSVQGGSDNVVVGSTFGSPKVGATYPIPGGAVAFLNSPRNRFEGNTVQGFRDDGLDFTISNSALGNGIATVRATDNYAGKNTVIGTGRADGLSAGSAIWPNCGSSNTWLYGNDARGTPECGVCAWLSKSVMVLGNTLHDNGITGLLASAGNSDTHAFCTANGGAFQDRVTPLFVQSNYVYYNNLDQLHIRNTDNALISSNILSSHNGFGGAQCPGGNCPAGIVYDINGGMPNNNTNARIVGNTSHDNTLGFQSDDGTTTGVEFAYNRMIQPIGGSAYNRYVVGSTVNFDGGSHTGGNYWTLFPSPNGNPGDHQYGTSGQSNPLLGVFDSLTNTSGKVIDRYPYQSEDFGKATTVTVSEPLAGMSFAQGTKRTVRWYAPACTYVDITMDDNSVLASNTGNTGYAIVTIPNSAVGAHTLNVTCKSSGGAALGSGASPTFNVTSSTLKLLSPGRDDVFNSGSEIIVSWTTTAATAVSVDLSTDGGVSFPTTLITTSTAQHARVTLPSVPSTSKAVIRVRNASNGAIVDYTDGYFAIRGTSGAAFANVASGRQFTMGQLERLEWSSPQNSRLVDITATVGGVAKTVASNLPDRGNFDWIVPEWASTGTMTLSASFKQSDGTAISGGISTTNGSAVFPVTQPPANPPRLFNISTRGQVGTGNNVMIGGFVISGSTPKTVVVRGIGPSMAGSVPGTLADPTLTLVTITGSVVASNDNWTSSPQQGQILAAGLQPSHFLESAIYATLSPGAYGAILSGVNNGTGIGQVEVYEVDHPEVPLANISTRGLVQTGNSQMIGGFVVNGNGTQNVVVRGIGPSLAGAGIAGVLQNPTLTVVRIDGSLVGSNDDWQSGSTAAQVQASGFAPSNPLESAMYLSLPPGAYGVIVAGVNNTTGVGQVEIYAAP